MKTLKQKVSITLDEGVIEEIKAMAEEDDRSFSQYINLVLRKYLNETKKTGCRWKKTEKVSEKDPPLCNNSRRVDFFVVDFILPRGVLPFPSLSAVPLTAW